MKITIPSFFQLLLCTMLILLNGTSNAAIYKYITKDGSTVLTGERLKGPGNKLVKIYQIKASGAYKSSIAKTEKNNVAETQKPSKSSWKKNKDRISNKIKV